MYLWVAILICVFVSLVSEIFAHQGVIASKKAVQ